MSYQDNGRYGGGASGGGYRGPKRAPYNPDSDRRPRDAPPPPESQGEKLRKQILAVGDGLEFDALQDLPRLIRTIEHQWFSAKDVILEGFTHGILEQPYKIPYYAAIISLLAGSPHMPGGEERWSAQDSAQGEEVKANVVATGTIGRQLVEALVRTFRTAVDARHWLHTRLLIQLFAHLAAIGLVSPASLLTLLQSLLAVIEELGVNPSRVEQAITCVGEALIRGGKSLYEHDPEAVASVLATIEVHVLTRPDRRNLVAPFGAQALGAGEELTEQRDTLIHLHTALATLSDDSFNPPAFLPRPHLLFGEAPVDPAGAYDIPNIMIPPAIVEEGEGLAGARERRTEGWAVVELEFFDEEVVPSPSSPAGWVLRQIVHDTITIFEINRKECARLLLELPNWLESGTFKPPPNVVVDPEAPQPTWSLESLIVSSVLSTIIRLPAPAHTTLYYTSLLVELCKFSPATVAPPVGKTARKLYAALDNGLDVESTRRVADWLSVHLSNFGFQWLWRDWAPDLELPRLHPKIAFMRRVVELEIRLSYHDRIKGTLPEAMQDPSAGILAEDSEAPYYPFENPENEHHLAAGRLETLLRSKTPPEAVIESLSELPGQPVDQPWTAQTRSIALQTFLFIGARSFSHFLNATERYLPLLRALAKTADERMDVLRAVGTFWRSSGQMRVIVGDKLMQYGIVTGEDVVRWVFEEEDDGSREATAEQWMAGQKWDVLRMGVDKVNGRVVGVRRNLIRIEAEEEEKRGGRRAAMNTGDEEKDDSAGGPVPDVDMDRSEAASTSRKTGLQVLTAFQGTQKTVLVAVVNRFVDVLLPQLRSSTTDGSKSGLAGLIAMGGWDAKQSWDVEDWLVWSQWGWWREFCRLYLHHLSTYTSTIEAVVFSTLDAPADDSDVAKALALVRGVWDGALEIAGASE